MGPAHVEQAVLEEAHALHKPVLILILILDTVQTTKNSRTPDIIRHIPGAPRALGIDDAHIAADSTHLVTTADLTDVGASKNMG